MFFNHFDGRRMVLADLGHTHDHRKRWVAERALLELRGGRRNPSQTS